MSASATSTTNSKTVIPTEAGRVGMNASATSTTNSKTVIPTEAGRRFFPSFVRERVGLRSGGISLRSLAQAKPKFSMSPFAHLHFPFFTPVL